MENNHIMKVIEDCFTKIGMWRRLHFGAYITNVAILIGGSTIHVLLEMAISSCIEYQETNTTTNWLV